MAHTVRDKEKLLKRVKRVVGQVEAVRRGLENEEDCADIMMLIAAARGAMNSLMAEVVEGHIRDHMVDPDRRPTSSEGRAAQQLIDVVRAYVR
jgi:FrmR/RcnR family transcriptional regulator, repressor of frmRAB operon